MCVLRGPAIDRLIMIGTPYALGTVRTQQLHFHDRCEAMYSANGRGGEPLANKTTRDRRKKTRHVSDHSKAFIPGEGRLSYPETCLAGIAHATRMSCSSRDARSSAVAVAAHRRRSLLASSASSKRSPQLSLLGRCVCVRACVCAHSH